MQLLLTRSGIVPWARASEVTRGLYLGACFPSGCFQSMSRHMHAQHWPRGIECTACRTPAPHAHQQCCSSGVMSSSKHSTLRRWSAAYLCAGHVARVCC
eukprot:1161684-Pelagomonas_calceolata.AAC.4